MEAHSSVLMGFPSGSDGKESACSAGDLGLIPGPGRSPGEWIGKPLGQSLIVHRISLNTVEQESDKKQSTAFYSVFLTG